jgi:transposase InsO family protein
VRFEWIHQFVGEFEVSIMCKVLQVSRSGYYAWMDRPPSAGAARQAELTEAIVQLHQGLRRAYGSDRGVQYASIDYRRLLQSQDISVSMSRLGDCYDNAMMESFWATLKKELVHHQDYSTREEARQSIFKYIECWYNRQRRHSAIGYKSPEQFEASLN